jgi:hypothetical protein
MGGNYIGKGTGFNSLTDLKATCLFNRILKASENDYRRCSRAKPHHTYDNSPGS